MSPRDKIADKDYIKHHYYERTTNGRTELVVRASRSPDVDRMAPPPVDLNDDEPQLKSERPPAESLGFNETHSTDSGTDAPEPRADDYRQDQDWKAADDQRIDEKTRAHGR